MVVRSAGLCKLYALLTLGLVSSLLLSCSLSGNTPVIPIALSDTPRQTAAGTPSGLPLTPTRMPAIDTPRPTREHTPSPEWTLAPSLVPTTSPASTPLALSWTGPLLVPAEPPDPAGNMESLIPIFDIGTGQSAQLPLMGFSSLVNIRGWSADGCFLVVSGQSIEGEGRPTCLVNVETGISRPLPDDARQVLFSPDGEWIAYAFTGYDAEGYPDPRLGRVSVARADGSAPASLLAEGLSGLRAWTDDSRKLVYWIGEGGQIEEGVYAVDVDSMEQCLISRMPYPLERWEDLYLADVASCERIPLPFSGSLGNADSVAVVHAPGYRYVALFPRESGGGGDFSFDALSLLVLDTKTGKAYTVFDEPFQASNFWTWSPDGTALVLEADFQDEWGVYLVEAATGQKRKLDAGTASAPSWSPDGRLLAFHSLDSGPFIYDLETGAITTLPTEFGYRRTPQGVPFYWSPRMSYGSGACR